MSAFYPPKSNPFYNHTMGIENTAENNGTEKRKKTSGFFSLIMTSMCDQPMSNLRQRIIHPDSVHKLHIVGWFTQRWTWRSFLLGCLPARRPRSSSCGSRTTVSRTRSGPRGQSVRRTPRRRASSSTRVRASPATAPRRCKILFLIVPISCIFPSVNSEHSNVFLRFVWNSGSQGQFVR